MAVVTYADDGTIILRSAQEVQVVQEAIRLYEKATGAVLNQRKSKVLAFGGWNNDTPVMGIEYHTELRILGILFAKTIRESATASWGHVTRNIRTQAQRAYYRDLPLYQRIQYANIPAGKGMAPSINFPAVRRYDKAD
jgi:hypothetical protein